MFQYIHVTDDNDRIIIPSMIGLTIEVFGRYNFYSRTDHGKNYGWACFENVHQKMSGRVRLRARIKILKKEEWINLKSI